jgi:heme/copper-type cytochrome/quinol oxidase subunit 1
LKKKFYSRRKRGAGKGPLNREDIETASVDDLSMGLLDKLVDNKKMYFMPRTISIPVYIILVCLGLIFGSMILILLWPIFETGVIHFRILGKAVGFEAVPFFISLGLLVAFVTLCIIIFRNKNSRLITTVLAILNGIAFIVSLNYQSFGWTSYPPLTSLSGKSDPIPGFFNIVFFSLLGLVVLLIGVIIFKWFKRRRGIKADIR